MLYEQHTLLFWFLYCCFAVNVRSYFLSISHTLNTQLYFYPVIWLRTYKKNSFLVLIYVQSYYCPVCPVFFGGLTLPVCLSCASWEHHFARKCRLLDLFGPVMQSAGRDNKRRGRCHPPQTRSSCRTGP